MDIPQSTRTDEIKYLKSIIASLRKLCRKTKHKLYKFVFAATTALEYAIKEKYDNFLIEMKNALNFEIPWGFRIQILNRLFRARKFLMERQCGSTIQGADLDKVWNMNIPDILLKHENEKSDRGYTRKDARELFLCNDTEWELKIMDI